MQLSNKYLRIVEPPKSEQVTQGNSRHKGESIIINQGWPHWKMNTEKERGFYISKPMFCILQYDHKCIMRDVNLRAQEIC